MARVLADDVALNYNGTNYYLNFIKANIYDGSGNNNGRLDPGETVNLTSLLRNIGGANFNNLNTTLQSSSPYVTINDNSGYFGSILIDSIKENTADPYQITVSPSCPQGHNAIFRLIASEGSFSDTFNFTLVVGSYHYLVWNPDITPSSGQTIHNLLTFNGYTGAITTNLLAEPTLDIYRSIFICCGVYPNNYRIAANGAEATAIINYLNNGGRVYMEGGEVWYYDPQVGGHNFNTMFGLVGVSDGSGDMGPVIGVSNTFTAEMNFNYSGENNYMDRINATTGYVIFQDGNNSYNCGVAYNAGTYRTIGVSFEFGSLVDGIAPSTKQILIDSIMKFFGIVLSGVQETPKTQIGSVQFRIYPNPIKIGKQVYFQCPADNYREVKVQIYNTLGSCVKTINIKNYQENIIGWDGKDDYNQKLNAGVYFIDLVLDNHKKISYRVVLVE